MSVDYNFQIDIARQGNANITSSDILKCYLEAGWSLYSEKNQIIYTTTGDDDDFNFLADTISEMQYFDIIKQKEKRKEMVAFALFYIENNIRYRIDVIITPELGMILSPDDATRKMLFSEFNILDVNWYLCKVFLPLKKKNILVESFSFIQL